MGMNFLLLRESPSPPALWLYSATHSGLSELAVWTRPPKARHETVYVQSSMFPKGARERKHQTVHVEVSSFKNKDWAFTQMDFFLPNAIILNFKWNNNNGSKMNFLKNTSLTSFTSFLFRFHSLLATKDGHKKLHNICSAKSTSHKLT